MWTIILWFVVVVEPIFYHVDFRKCLDTDSIFFAHPNNVNPIPVGKGHLGEMTKEYEDWCIEEFVSGGLLAKKIITDTKKMREF